jgi:hypothetical protein
MDLRQSDFLRNCKHGAGSLVDQHTVVCGPSPSMGFAGVERSFSSMSCGSAPGGNPLRVCGLAQNGCVWLQGVTSAVTTVADGAVGVTKVGVSATTHNVAVDVSVSVCL